MTRPLIQELRDGDRVDMPLLVRSKFLGSDKNGRAFLAMRLADRSGEIDARAFDRAEALAEGVVEGRVVRVRGEAKMHKSHLQIMLEGVEIPPPGEISASDFLPASMRSGEDMEAELRDFAEGIDDPHIRALFFAFINDTALLEKLKQVPAGKTVHHAYLGGLLEHKLSLMKLGSLVANHYRPIVHRDVLLCGLFLHDIGKTYEISVDQGFEYTEDGQLIGHLARGLLMLTEKAATVPDFPPRLLRVLQHCILGHHGRLEYGSPKLPMTVEALLVAMLDDLDGKVQSLQAGIEGLAEKEVWTPMLRGWDRPLFDWRKADALDRGATNVGPWGGPRSMTPRNQRKHHSQRPAGGGGSGQGGGQGGSGQGGGGERTGQGTRGQSGEGTRGGRHPPGPGQGTVGRSEPRGERRSAPDIKPMAGISLGALLGGKLGGNGFADRWKRVGEIAQAHEASGAIEGTPPTVAMPSADASTPSPPLHGTIEGHSGAATSSAIEAPMESHSSGVIPESTPTPTTITDSERTPAASTPASEVNPAATPANSSTPEASHDPHEPDSTI